MNDLINEIAGKKFVIVEIPFFPIKRITERYVKIINKYGLLYQGIKSVNYGGFWRNTCVIQTFLCPEEKYISFAQEFLD